MARSALLGCVVLLVVGVLIAGVLAVGGYNRLNTADQAVNASWADVENNYQRRADLIPNLVETVKGAATFERETLEAVVKARASATQVRLDANSIKDPAAFESFQKAQDELSSSLARLLVTVESYPDIKANQNFRDLQVQLEGTENRIAVARSRFNEATQAYNTQRKSFPTVIIANLAGFKDRPYFRATAGAETAPKVKF